MARGYQGDHGDVRALAMKKWFNTNYHYMVPEIEDDTEVKLAGTKLFDEFNEALALNINTKSVIAGPFTLLKLIRYTGEKQLKDFVEPVIDAYTDLLKKAQETEISWIQFDEPYLVHDLTSDDIKLVEQIYTALLSHKGTLKVLLQTYFGDVRDIYENLTKLNFDGIGLDFIEGKETKNLIKRYGFPTDKLLFAGIVNGKNIWRNHYGNTSCSLLHVPYTLNNGTKLDKDYTKHFAFAEEKLGELEELKTLSELDSYENHQAFVKNLALFENRKDCYDPKVAKRVSEITEDEYIAFNRKKIKECIKLQEEINLDVLVHGEYERNDMVEYFGQKLNGYLFTEKAWVQSYGTRCVKPPIIWGDVSRPEAMTVDWSVYAQSLTDRPMKGMLTGPVTILNWSFPREDISIKESTYQIALAILDSLKENNFKTEVGPGVYDIHSPRVPSVEEIKTALYKMLQKIEIEKLWVNPDCGLKTRGEEETTKSLKNLVIAAKELRP